MSTDTSLEPRELLPLKPRWFHILLALADGALHGYAIRDAVEGRTDGALRMWPATLYGSIRELSEQGAIEALEGQDDPDDDQRRRYYRLTPFGRELLRAEAERLRELVEAAYASRALGKA
jgi:DNA-binding PadR family transcriptional regulator